MWFRTNSFRILKLFFDEPDREFYLREIARLAKISPASVHQIMKELEKMKVVRREKTPAIDKFKAIEEGEFIALKRAYNLYILTTSKGFSQFLHYAEPQAVWICGTFSQGRDTRKEGIQVYVIESRYANFHPQGWETELGRTLHLTYIPKRRIREHNKELLEGTLIYGHAEE